MTYNKDGGGQVVLGHVVKTSQKCLQIQREGSVGYWTGGRLEAGAAINHDNTSSDNYLYQSTHYYD